ncbi:glycosyltransferase family 39 protein [Candidatus Woesearchaeota archaeon]|nr:glycosyltransferase family 39 protein [Candidatus Woesearchaeota archaeon]
MKWLKKLIFWYILFVIVKTILSYFVPSPTAFSDSYYYMEMAKTFFHNFNFGGKELPHFPLYPIWISIAYLFKNPVTIYTAIKILNSLISSTIIFPAWFLSKEFMSKRVALKIAIMVSLIPPMFSFAPYIMSENIFFPLFLFSSYFLYKSAIEPKNKWSILAGIFIGLAISSRIIAIALLVPLFTIWFFDVLYLGREKHFKSKIILLVFLLLTLSPLIIKNFIDFGFTLLALVGRYSPGIEEPVSRGYPFLRIIPRFFLVLGYVILSSLVIYLLSIPSLFKNLRKNYKLFIFTLISLSSVLGLILIQVNHGIHWDAFLFKGLGGRLIGRYLAAGFPLIFILGSIAIFKKRNIPKKYLILSSLILIFSANLVLIPLFPINNMSLTYIGVFSFILDIFLSPYAKLSLFVVIFGSLPFLFYKIYNKVSFKQITTLTMIFFIFLGVLNYSVIAFDSYKYWYKGDQMQLGLWFNEYDKGKSRLLFDERDTGEKIWKLNQSIICDANFCPMEIWINNEIARGNPEKPQKDFKPDYIVSKHKLNLTVVKELGGIYIYRSR